MTFVVIFSFKLYCGWLDTANTTDWVRKVMSQEHIVLPLGGIVLWWVSCSTVCLPVYQSAACCALCRYSSFGKRLDSSLDKAKHLLQSCHSVATVSETVSSHINLLRDWLMSAREKMDSSALSAGVGFLQAREALSEHNVSSTFLLCYDFSTKEF